MTASALVLCLLHVPASGAASSSIGLPADAAPDSIRGAIYPAGASEPVSLSDEVVENRTCPSAHKAIKFYSRRIAEHRVRMGRTDAGLKVPRLSQVGPGSSVGPCPRYLAHVLQRKARAWRVRAERYVAYHYDWPSWLPAKHQRVARCETGYQGGAGPGGSRWDWDSGTYVSAFGIYLPAYNADAARVGNLGWHETIRKLGRYPTPREQYQAVESHRAAHGGWSGWGCRGA